MYLIDADVMCEMCGEPNPIKCSNCKVPQMESVDAEPVKHGRWIKKVESKLNPYTGEYYEEEYKKQYRNRNTSYNGGIQIAQPADKAQLLIALAVIFCDGNQGTDDHTDQQCAEGDDQGIAKTFHHPHIAVIYDEGLM